MQRGRGRGPCLSDRGPRFRAYIASDILGVGVDVVTAEEAVHRIAAFWRSGGSHQVVTLNPEMIMAARRDAALRGILRECSLVVADGIGVVWASRVLGKRLPERVAGSRSRRRRTRGGGERAAGGGVARRPARRRGRSSGSAHSVVPRVTGERDVTRVLY